MLDLLYWDAEVLLLLQQKLHPLPLLQPLTNLITQAGDPRYSYLVIFPLVFWLYSPLAGGRVLTVAAMAEWLNIILKWVLRGERPYWWVHEAQEWPQDQQLLQGPLTCETGPGNPSGHVMITLAVLLTWLHNIPASDGHLRAPPAVGLLHTAENLLLWAGTGLLVSLVAISRLLTATHFLHQVLFALVVGWLLHRLTAQSSLFRSSTQIQRSSSLTLACSSAILLLTALALYCLLALLDLDPAFSVPKALRFCEDPSWVHLDTTPFYSLMRSCGTLLGMAAVARFCATLWNRGSPPTRRWPGLVASLVLVLLVRSVPVHTTNNIIFYVASLLKSSLVPVAALVPKVMLSD